MNCADFHARERDFAYGRLGGEALARCVEHLRACPSCGERYARACGMTCREVAGFLHDYLADELPAERRRAFEDHVHVCEECEAYLDGYRRTVSLGRDALSEDDGPAVAAVPERLVEAILAAREEQERKPS